MPGSPSSRGRRQRRRWAESSLLDELSDDLVFVILRGLTSRDQVSFTDIACLALTSKLWRDRITRYLRQPTLTMLKQLISNSSLPDSWENLEDDDESDWWYEAFHEFREDAWSSGTALRRSFAPLKALGLEFEALRAAVELQNGARGHDSWDGPRTQLECFLIGYHSEPTHGPINRLQRHWFRAYDTTYILDELSANALGAAAAKLQLSRSDVLAIFASCMRKDGDPYDDGVTLDAVIAWGENADLFAAGWAPSDVASLCKELPRVLCAPYKGFTKEAFACAIRPFMEACVTFTSKLVASKTAQFFELIRHNPVGLNLEAFCDEVFQELNQMMSVVTEAATSLGKEVKEEREERARRQPRRSPRLACRGSESGESGSES